MRVTLPDDLHETLVSQLRGNQTLDAEIERRLRATEHLAGGEHFLLLSGRQLDQLTAALGRGINPRNFEDLLAYVHRRAAITFGGVALDFSIGQIEELQRLADREKQPLAGYILRVAKTFTSQFFRTVPAREEWPQLLPSDNLPDPNDLDALLRATQGVPPNA